MIKIRSQFIVVFCCCYSQGSPLILDFVLRCSNSDSRKAAYDVLVELADGYLPIMTELSNELISIHHFTTNENANEWEVSPRVLK